MTTKGASEAASRKAGAGKTASGKGSRHRAREFALQGLYQWQLTAADASAIENDLREATSFGRIDADYFHAILHGAVGQAARLDATIEPYLDRKVGELSPIERGILLIGAYELGEQLDVPYRVVINEAVELAKTFGGTDGHKYVNGVLDKLAVQLRPEEIEK